jgi:signal transduction histidine kinase
VVGSFDRLRIEQVFLNLLTNALKYGAQQPIAISVEATLNHAIIAFKDKGVGIAKTDQTRIFDRFERVESNANIGGLGLGLYITRQIVAAHGGKIAVESEPLLGSTFTVSLPLTPRTIQ